MEKITLIAIALYHNKRTLLSPKQATIRLRTLHVVLKYCVAQARCLQVAPNQVQFCSGSVCQTGMAGFCTL